MPEFFRFFATQVTSTNSVTILQTPEATTAVLRTLTLCNPSTSTATSCDISLHRTAESASWFINRYGSINGKQTILPISTPIVVVHGDEVKVAAAGAGIDVTVSYLEVT